MLVSVRPSTDTTVPPQIVNQGQPLPQSLEILELRSLATALSAQNKNLQDIAIGQKQVIEERDQTISSMQVYMSELNVKCKERISALQDEHQSSLKHLN